MSHEREIAEEQAFLTRALDALDHMRGEAQHMRDDAAVATMRGAGDLIEREVQMGTALHRIDQLTIGDQPLFFGRIDRLPDEAGLAERFHVGRIAVSDEQLNPLVIDWRAPIAEAFYRATGVEPLGLARRRHVSIRQQHVVSVEDEYFADERGELALPDDEVRAATEEGLVDGGLALGGPGALLAALGRARTGRMGDIVATIQGEQDQIIRAPRAGVLLVQGGPGTGKTAVALHRAAYLLYTYRADLEKQGILVVGPNALFLTYIENVLPSLGESGVTLATVAGLVTNVTVRASESEDLDQLKGDARMARVIARAVRTRQRPLRHDVDIPIGRAIITVRAEDTADVIERARRRNTNHNSRRSALSRELANRLAQRYHRRFSAEGDGLSIEELAEQIRSAPEFKEVVQRIWPRITGQELLHDLYSKPALLQVAGKNILSDQEIALLVRERSASFDEIPWTKADAALIDEARVHLGPRKKPKAASSRHDNGVDLSAYSGDVRAAALREMERLRAATEPELDEAEFVTYGHIVIDEAQDLSPMEVRVIKRRDLTGSMTVVGDMGQATTPASSASWDAVLAELQPRQTPRRVDLTVSYRTPEEVLEFAAPTLRAAAAGLEPPRPVRRAGVEPRITETNPADLAVAVMRVVGEEVRAVAPGRVAVIAPRSRVSALTRALQEAGLDAVDPRDDDPRGLSADLVVVAAEGANGLEFDAVVVVEPAEIVARGAQPGAVTPRGLRTFYVAMTRPTRRLTLVTSQALPATINP